MGRIVPYIMENKTCSKPPTSKSWLNRQSFGLKHQKIVFWTTNLIWLWIKNLADEHEDSYLASIDVHSWNYDTRGCDPSSMPTKYIPDLSKQGKHHSWKLFSYKYAAFQLELSRRRNNRVWRVKWPITNSVEGSISSWLGLLLQFKWLIFFTFGNRSLRHSIHYRILVILIKLNLIHSCSFLWLWWNFQHCETSVFSRLRPSLYPLFPCWKSQALHHFPKTKTHDFGAHIVSNPKIIALVGLYLINT